MPFTITNQLAAGIIKDVPERKNISNHNYEFLLEHGRLRYFSFFGNEFIRMIHVAVRDENWMTVPYEITDINLQSAGEKLLITYSAIYSSTTISFVAQIKIEADPDGMQFSFSGVAENDFLKNRIGICLLLPVENCSIQRCAIINAKGDRVEGHFPDEISAHQPFVDITAMEWQTKEGIVVAASFSDEIFEMEDQRNWSDHSYKIYGTPLRLPFPVQMKRGDKVEQSVSLHFRFPEKKPEKQILSIKRSGAKAQFPLIGLQFTGKLREHQNGAGLLKHLSLHHLRIDLSFEENWQENLFYAFRSSVEISAFVELVITVKGDVIPVESICRIIRETDASVFSVLLLTAGNSVTSIPDVQAPVNLFREHLKDVLIGTGTALHFAEINRFYEKQQGINFLAFPINPQVHASDTLTIIENLVAFREMIQALNRFGMPIHISRLTLRYPDNPDHSGGNRYDDMPGGRPWVEDSRQDSLFCAAWMALALKYLAGAASITLFDDFGASGIIKDKSTVLDYSQVSVTPAYLVLQEVALFAPTLVSGLICSQPLIADGVCFENEAGKKLFMLVNWSSSTVSVGTDLFGSCINAMFKKLDEMQLEEKLRLPLDWAGKGYTQIDLLKENLFELGAGQVYFVIVS
jgi:hypothetical protein